MADNFKRSLQHVLRYEGGFSNHPEDPGGATNYGITQRVLSEWREKPVSVADVKALQMGEVEQIYRARYWLKACCDWYPDGIDLAVFDCAVNQGVGRATRMLQAALGVKQDGIIGPVTRAAIHDARSDEILCEFMARRMFAYGMLKSLFRTFGLGWSRRLIDTYSTAEWMREAYEGRKNAP